MIDSFVWIRIQIESLPGYLDEHRHTETSTEYIPTSLRERDRVFSFFRVSPLASEQCRINEHLNAQWFLLRAAPMHKLDAGTHSRI